jgi:hypothetical protein
MHRYIGDNLHEFCMKSSFAMHRGTQLSAVVRYSHINNIHWWFVWLRIILACERLVRFFGGKRCSAPVVSHAHVPFPIGRVPIASSKSDFPLIIGTHTHHIYMHIISAGGILPASDASCPGQKMPRSWLEYQYVRALICGNLFSWPA